MIDAGMDQQVHNFFGRGVVEPYFPDAAREVERALRAAKSIVVTHEHGDHAAGVLRGPDVAQLAPKTILTRTQVDTLLNNPQMPEIKLTPALAARYNVVDYDKYMPYGPGIALIKSPGHTPGSQMVYVALDSGREYLFIGDAAWHMDSVRQLKGKDAPWVTENKDQVMAQLRWLNQLERTEKNLFVIASHDQEQHQELVENEKILGGKLE
jgi:glyoxylase-like metal-dependent hydrolase (beta-lactamase superfamily II)